MTSWFGHDVTLDFVPHDPADVIAAVTAAGLEQVEWYVRGPVLAREETTDRFYVLARAPHRLPLVAARDLLTRARSGRRST